MEKQFKLSVSSKDTNKDFTIIIQNNKYYGKDSNNNKYPISNTSTFVEKANKLIYSRIDNDKYKLDIQTRNINTLANADKSKLEIINKYWCAIKPGNIIKGYINTNNEIIIVKY